MSDDRPFFAPLREPPLVVQLAQLRARRDELAASCEAMRTAIARRPWSVGQVVVGVCLGLLGGPVAGLLIGAFGLLVATLLQARRPPPTVDVEPPPPISGAPGASPRCGVRDCQPSQDGYARITGVYECPASAEANWDGGLAGDISWQAGRCDGGDPCRVGNDCWVGGLAPYTVCAGKCQ